MAFLLLHAVGHHSEKVHPARGVFESQNRGWADPRDQCKRLWARLFSTMWIAVFIAIDLHWLVHADDANKGSRLHWDIWGTGWQSSFSLLRRCCSVVHNCMPLKVWYAVCWCDILLCILDSGRPQNVARLLAVGSTLMLNSKLSAFAVDLQHNIGLQLLQMSVLHPVKERDCQTMHVLC